MQTNKENQDCLGAVGVINSHFAFFNVKFVIVVKYTQHKIHYFNHL